MSVPPSLTALFASVNRTHVLPLFISCGTTAERTQSAAHAYLSHFGVYPAKVQIHASTDDGSRAAGFETIIETRDVPAPNTWMLYAIGAASQTVVYPVSKWNNASRHRARHIPSGDDQRPLCWKPGKFKHVFSWATEEGEPTCADCISKAKVSA